MTCLAKCLNRCVLQRTSLNYQNHRIARLLFSRRQTRVYLVSLLYDLDLDLDPVNSYSTMNYRYDDEL